MEEINTRLFISFAIGIALTIAGFANALLAGYGRWLRLFNLTLATVLALGVVNLIAPDLAVWIAGFSAAIISVCMFAMVPGVRRTTRRCVTSAIQFGAILIRPRIGWAATGVFGVALIAQGMIRYNLEVERHADVDLQTLETMEFAGIQLEDSHSVIRTDRGKVVQLKKPAATVATDISASEKRWLENSPLKEKVIHRQAAACQSNCHGWVFTGGKYIIPGVNVDPILADNNYHIVDFPRPEDVVVYRDDSGNVSHTAIVRARLSDGTILVEGKWGFLGVFLHAVNESCYGVHYSFYHTDRNSHMLSGIENAID